MFLVEWKPQVWKSLRKLPRFLAERIHDKVACAASDPARYLERLVSDDCYKLRVGDYRIIIDIDFQKRLLIVCDIDHRSRIYKR